MWDIPPVTPESIAAAKHAQACDRAKAIDAGVRPDYFDPRDPLVDRREEAHDKLTLDQLVQRWGAKRVDRWLHNLAAIYHQEV